MINSDNQPVSRDVRLPKHLCQERFGCSMAQRALGSNRICKTG